MVTNPSLMSSFSIVDLRRDLVIRQKATTSENEEWLSWLDLRRKQIE